MSYKEYYVVICIGFIYNEWSYVLGFKNERIFYSGMYIWYILCFEEYLNVMLMILIYIN